MDNNKCLNVSSAWDSEEIEKMPEQDSTPPESVVLPPASDKTEDKDGFLGRNMNKPPKKWNFPESGESEERKESGDSGVFHLGDLVWCRLPNSCFYPAVVVQDPHFKFFTKIVKSETSNSESGKGLNDDCMKERQYHVQFIGDNKIQWISGKYCKEYQGIPEYEKLAIKDSSNLKIYKPRAEKMQGWRDALVVADDLAGCEKSERVKKMETARLADKSGKSFIKKIDLENKNFGSDLNSPVKPKHLPSPRKPAEPEGKDQRKSAQYRRQEEMDYKMHKMTEARSSEKPKKSKPSSESESPQIKLTPAPPIFKSNASFSKSFKIKKDKKPEEEDKEAEVLNKNESVIKEIPIAPDQDKKSEVEPVNENTNNTEAVPEVSDYILTGQKTEQIAKSDGFGDGALVWAKMRGYPFWPSVVTRDSVDGEFVKVADTIYKKSRRIHVLFLEYGKQTAWIGSSSIKKFQGIEGFRQDKEKASKKSKPDYTPNKRTQSQFNKAVEYAEELVGLSDEERLEEVLLKYGWGMVANVDGEDQGSNVTDTPQEMEIEPSNGRTEDAESRTELSTPDPVKRKQKNLNRRSSVEAQSTIDPSTDEPVEVPRSKPEKRESSLIAAIVMNGVNSDSDTDDSLSLPIKKKLKPNNKKGDSAKKPLKPVTPKPVQNEAPSKPSKVSTPSTPLTLKESGDKDEFPRVGDLVWGRMPGFPFWPAFVTRSPEGSYNRVLANGKTTSHVQFFGWNDESGWVTTVLEFEGLESFKALAGKKKSDKSYNPGKGANYKKWEKAAREAEDTMGLTRQERVDQYMVSYAHKLLPSSQPKTPSSPKAPSTPKTPSRTPGLSKPAGSPATPKGSSKRPLPRGWISETRTKDGKELTVYVSPDGEEFTSKASMQRHISEGKNCLGVVYLEDSSLPQGWRCQKIESSIFFFSPIGERFESRRKVAERMKSDNYSEEAVNRVLAADKSRRPAPKSVLKSRGEYLSDESSVESENEEDLVKILPKGFKYRFGGPYDKFLDIEKIFDPSDGGLIDMVQLPDIFLAHPTVRVQESDNEMIISDVDTGEFIAKKIIYD